MTALATASGAALRIAGVWHRFCTSSAACRPCRPVQRYSTVILAVLLLAWMCGSAGVVQAEQSAGAISGRVLFPDGTPVVGAKVAISRASGQPATETTTDARGLFTAGGLVPGAYGVAVEQDGAAGARRREHRTVLLIKVPPRNQGTNGSWGAYGLT